MWSPQTEHVFVKSLESLHFHMPCKLRTTVRVTAEKDQLLRVSPHDEDEGVRVRLVWLSFSARWAVRAELKAPGGSVRTSLEEAWSVLARLRESAACITKERGPGSASARGGAAESRIVISAKNPRPASSALTAKDRLRE